MKHPVRRQCEVEGCDRPRSGTMRVCAYHNSRHAPIPAHHVAAIRTCIRCRTGFESSWQGERICKPCRYQEARNAKDAIERGQTAATYESPYEPQDIPGIAS